MKGRPRVPVVVEPKVRVNQKIRAPKVRVIAPDGEQLGILDVSDALRRSEEFGLDLVEVAPNGDPPVCKIMDDGKYRFEESKKDHERKKKQAVITIKEIKLRPKTEEHDLDYKVRKLVAFIEEGSKVKVTIMFKGREITHPQQAHVLVNKIMELIKDKANVEQPAKFEGRNMTLVVGPK
jgi:translation initiation factor IF-3